jgi:hypothetical protein
MEYGKKDDDFLVRTISMKVINVLNKSKLDNVFAVSKILIDDLYHGKVQDALSQDPNKDVTLGKIAKSISDSSGERIGPELLGVWIRIAGRLHPMLKEKLTEDELKKVTYRHYRYLLRLDTDDARIKSAREETGLTAKEYAEMRKQAKEEGKGETSTGDVGGKGTQVTSETSHSNPYEQALDALMKLGWSKEISQSAISKVKPLFSDVNPTTEEIVQAACAGKPVPPQSEPALQPQVNSVPLPISSHGEALKSVSARANAPLTENAPVTEGVAKPLTEEGIPIDRAAKISQMVQDATRRILARMPTPLRWTKRHAKDMGLKKYISVDWLPGPVQIQKMTLGELKEKRDIATLWLQKYVAVSIMISLFIEESTRIISEKEAAEPVNEKPISIDTRQPLTDREMDRRTKPLTINGPETLTEGAESQRDSFAEEMDQSGP